MNEEERWRFIFELDDELLKGGVVLSEWCTFIVRQADVAFVGNAHLAAIVLAIAAIETHLRSEYGDGHKISLYELIETSPIEASLKEKIHDLRIYRNKWVHINDPHDDEDLQNVPEKYENELERKAKDAIRVLRTVIHENQWI